MMKLILVFVFFLIPFYVISADATIDLPSPVASIYDGQEVNGGFFDTLETGHNIIVVVIDDVIYALVTSFNDNGVQIIDISDPSEPVPVASATNGSKATNGKTFDTLSKPYGITTIKIDGSTYALVVSSGDNGVQIIDISDPSKPVPVASAIDGETVGGKTFDLSRPREIAVVEIDGTIHALVTSFESDNVQIIDISNPKTPVPVISLRDGTTATNKETFLLDGPRGITTTKLSAHTYALVVSSNDDGVQIIDISDPKTPVPVISLHDDQNDANGMPFDTLARPYAITTTKIGLNTYALVTSIGDHGVQIIDISNPLLPVPVASAINGEKATNEETFTTLSKPYGITTIKIDGSTYALVTSTSDNGVQIIDISDPSEPVPVASAIDGDEVGGIPFERLQTAWGVTTTTIDDSTYALVTSQGSDNGVQIIDISGTKTGATSVENSDVVDGVPYDTLLGSDSITTAKIGSHTYALITSILDYHGVQIIDISNPKTPVPVISFRDGQKATNGMPFDTLTIPRDITTIKIDNSTYALVTSFIDNGVQIIDISEPSEPVPVASAIDGETVGGKTFDTLASPYAITTTKIGSGTYALVTSIHDHGVQIIDISNPLLPVPVASAVNGTEIDGKTFDTLADPYAITTTKIGSGTYALVTSTSDNGVQIIDISNPKTPVPVISFRDGQNGANGMPFDTLTIPRDITTIKIDNSTYALVASQGSDNGVQIIDISEPSEPVPVASAIDGETVGGKTFDTLAGSYAITTTKIGSGTYALVASIRDNGVQIIYISNPMTPVPVTSFRDGRATNGISFDTLNNPRDIVTSIVDNSTYALVTSFGDHGVQIIDLDFFDLQVDTTAPVITVIPDEITLELGADSPDLLDGVTTDDNSAVTTTGTVDTNVVGDYVIGYNSTDGTNPAMQKSRTYHVVDTTAPVITVIPDEITLELGADSPDLLDGVTTDDNSAVTTTGTVDTGTVGEYIIRYDSTDGTNPAMQKSRTYHVVDTTAPVITVIPDEITLELGADSPDLLDGVTTDDGSAVTTTGTVDTNVVGDYVIGYNSTDGTNPAMQKSRTYHVVDTTAPVITVIPDEITLELGADSPDLLDGVTTDDNSAVTTTGTVDTNVVGDYVIGYNSTDGTNPAMQKSRTYHVVDTTAPVITVIPDEITLELGADSPDLLDGVTTDDGSAVTTTGTVDTNVVGDYVIGYNSTDGTNPAMQKSRTYHVVDTTAPVITVIPDEITLELGADSPDLLDGVTTDDNSAVTTTGTVDTGTVGEYIIRYDSTDGTNPAMQKSRTYHVVDTTAPVITVIPDEITLELGADSPDLLDGVTTDDGSAVTTTGTVDTNVVGDYVIGYNSTDGTNPAMQKSRTYHVVDTTAPVITVIPDEITLELGADSPDLLDGVTTDDNSAVTTTGTVDTGTVGEYIIRYDSTDGTNPAMQKSRTYHVVDTTAPVITVIPDEITLELGADSPDLLDGVTTDDGSAVTTTGTVDTNVVGDYVIGYNSTDGTNPAMQKSRTYHVVDTTAPVITVIPDEITLELGADSPDLLDGVTTDDNSAVTTTGTVDTGTVGEYIIRYDSTDGTNPAMQKSRTYHVVDTTAPVITVIPDEITLELGADSPDLLDGVTTDDGSAVTTTGTVDTNVVGDYVIGYNSTDGTNPAMQKSRTYHVVDTTAPVITVIPDEITLELGADSPDLLDGVTTDDGSAVTTTGTVDTNVVGDYVIGYNSTDGTNPAMQKSRTYHVVDTTAPVITVIPDEITLELGADSPDLLDGVTTDDNSAVTTTGTVDTGTVGEYIIRYDSTDGTNPAMQKSRTYHVVDTTAPVITVIPDEITLELGADSPDLLDGVTTDDGSAVTTTGTVDTNVVGDYVIGYNSTDGTNPAMQKSRTYHVVDTTAPVITVIPDEITLELGADSPDLLDGVTTDDNSAVTTTGTVDTGTVGEYIIRYDSTDGTNPAMQKSRTYHVVDTTAPVITVIPDEITLELGADSPDLLDGVTTDDNSAVTTTGTVDTNVVGDYVIGYNSTDGTNPAMQKSRTYHVVDTTAPVITVIPDEITLELGADSPDLLDGVTTDDNSAVTTTGTVDTNVVGDYVIGYNSTDGTNPAMQKSRTYHVVDTTAPVITVIPDEITLELGADSPDLLDGVTTDDNSAVTTTGTVDTGTVGEYIIRYDSTDGTNPAMQKSRTYHVVDTTAPVITVIPDEITLELGADSPDLLDGVTTDDNSAVTTTGTVDTNVVGDYVIGYNSTDGTNPAMQKSRTYHVVDTTAPVITVIPDEITLELGADSPDLLDGVTTDDGSAVTTTGTVDTGTVGEYIIRYDSTDGTNPAMQKSRTYHVVDTTAPVITVIPDEITLELGADSPDLLDGVTTDDNSAVTTTGTVDTNVVGDYVIGYNSTDGTNPAMQKSRTYHVVDTTAPVITVIPDEITLELGADSPDLLDGVTTDDNSAVTTTGTVDTNVVGDYVIGYNSTDGTNPAMQKSRTYHVVDTTAPVITVIPDEITLELGADSPDLLDGVTTDDNSAVTTTGTVDTGTVGEYIIRYDSTDGTNPAMQKSRTYHVVDTTAPVITVIPDEITLELGADSPDLLDGVTTDDNSAVTTTGTVDTGTVGEYIIRYDSTDGTNPAMQKSRTYHVVDTTAPVITVIPDEITLELGADSPDLLDGVTTDDGSAVTTTGTVDTGTVGEYIIRYDSTDGTNPAMQKSRTYHVVDTTAPVITVIPDEITLELGADSPDLLDGVTTDDGSAVTTTGTVDTNVVGDYVIGYNSTDGTNPAMQKSRTYHVVDTTAPVITVIPDEITLELGADSPDLLDGVTTSDNSAVTTTGTVDTNVVGDYVIGYNSTDGTNPAMQKSRTYHVVDTTAPVITVIPDEITLELGADSPDLLDGVTTSDNSAVTTTGTVDTNVVGDYVIGYNSTDGTNPAMQKSRTYHVVDTTAPVITVIPDEITLELGADSPDLLDGVTTDDNSAVTTTGTVDTNVVGDYVIGYNSTDGTNPAMQKSRTYHVVDTTAPVITVIPDEITLELGADSPDLLDGVTTDDNSAVTTTGTVDTNVVGDYVIGYNSTDGTNPAMQKSRTYHVVDTTAPVITVIPDEITLELGADSPDLLDGVTTDDGSAVTTTGTVDTNVVGDYVIGYNSTDGTNPAMQKSRTYHVVDNPPDPNLPENPNENPPDPNLPENPNENPPDPNLPENPNENPPDPNLPENPNENPSDPNLPENPNENLEDPSDDGVPVSDVPRGKSGNSDEHKTRPTFGKSWNTYAQIVSCGYSMDGICKDVLSYVVDNPLQELQTGFVHNFTLKTFAPKGMKFFSIGFGVPDVGSPLNDAEALIRVYLTRDYNTTSTYVIDSVSYQNEDMVIGQNATFAVSAVKCMPDSTLERCVQLDIAGVLFREQMHNEPFVIQAVDTKRRVTNHYMNDGITIAGDSMNPAPTVTLITKFASQSDVEPYELVRTDKINDMWIDQFGYTWTKNGFGTWYYVDGPEFIVSTACTDVENRLCDAFDRNMAEHTRLMEQLRDARYGNVHGDR